MSFQASPEQVARFGRVAVVYGGQSAERAVSLKSGIAVLAALRRAGVQAFGIDLYGETGSDNPIEQLCTAEYDRAFLMLHGRGGEDGTIQGLLETLKRPYTGSGVTASALGMDKLRSKQLFVGTGLPTPSFHLLNTLEDLAICADRLGFPLMVKPVHEGSSIGMHKVHNQEELLTAWQDASQYDTCVIAEQWITGREFTVGILNNQALPAIRLETPHDFYDFNAKYEADDTGYFFDNTLSVQQKETLSMTALRAFQAIGCRGWGRVDLMQDHAGHFYLLEVNTLPGMTDHSLVPMAAARAGIGFEELVVNILDGSCT